MFLLPLTRTRRAFCQTGREIFLSHKEHQQDDFCNRRNKKSSKSFGKTYCFMVWDVLIQTCRKGIARAARCSSPASTQRGSWLCQRRGAVGSPDKKKSRKPFLISCYAMLLLDGGVLSFRLKFQLYKREFISPVLFTYWCISI